MKPANGGVPRRSFLQGTLSAGAAGLLAQTKKAKAQQSAPVVQKTVYAWYPGRFGTWNTSSIQWDALTHICFRSVVLQADGSIARPAGSPPQAFLDEARSHGVKVCILAWANNRNDSDGYLADNPDRAVENLLAYVRENGLDGISYDDEMIGRTNSRTGGPSQPLVSAFFQKLYEAFKSASSSYHISYASPPVISAKDRFGPDYFDWAAIAPCVDAIVPMMYTANPPQIGWTTVAQPLAGSKDGGPTVPRDVVTLMGEYYAQLGEHRGKLLLGVNSFPWPGYEFRARSAARLATILERGRTKPYAEMLEQAALYGRRWDSRQQASWYAYQDGEEFVQGWFDDEHSWAAKLDYVNQEELGGVGIWVVDGQNDSPAMWEMLRTAFGGTKAKMSVQPGADASTEPNTTRDGFSPG